MNLVHDRLYVGSELDCRNGTPTLAVVHACKSPCHQAAVGYKKSLPSTHPFYLAYEQPRNLYLNIIDPPAPLFMLQTFVAFLDFTRTNYDAGVPILIHCNRGESRAPSLALLFMSKHLGSIPNSSFSEARIAFAMVYPHFQPGIGIQQFLSANWHKIH